jgi:hypothetical protein
MYDDLRHYPWDHLDVVRAMPSNHWFYRGYTRLSRTPNREELQLPQPPFGLIRDEDFYEEMQLHEFLQRRVARREAAQASHLVSRPGKQLVVYVLSRQTIVLIIMH